MANVPAVLIVGDYMVQGGAPGVLASFTASGTSALQTFGDHELLGIVPADASTGAPTASTLGWYPWFDGNYGSLLVVGSSTATTITVSPSPGWTIDQFAGLTVTVIEAATVGFSHRKAIVSNTADTITVTSWGGSTPAPGRLFFIGTGAFRDYHPAAAWLHGSEIGVVPSTRGGSSWQALGNGVGIDAGLMHRLQEIYPTSPRFQVAKYAGVATTVGNWGTAGTGIRTAFEAWLARVNTAWAALASGNTLSWDLIVWDNSQRDVLDWASSPGNALLYRAALESTISYLRTTLGNATAQVVLLNHDGEINALASPNGSLFANREHRTVAEEDANVSVVSMAGQRLRGDDPSYGLPTENREFYAASVYWDQMATAVATAHERYLSGAPTANEAGYPTYILIGDSICVGQISATYAATLNSPTLTGGARGTEQGIYNRTTGLIEAYDLADNSNTSGTVVATGGPEYSLMHELEQLHPDGFCLIKRGSNSSALAAELTPYVGTGSAGGTWTSAVDGEHWTELKADYAGAVGYINAVLGKQADVRGIFVILGTNDAAVSGGGAVFAGALKTFVADLRDAFGTRTSGDALPVIWRKPQLDTATALTGEIQTIRSALEAAALTDEQLVLVNVDDLERDATDNIHETPESSVIDGQRMVEQVQTITL